MSNRKVKIIPKSETREVLKNKSQVESKNKLNVAAYCRVSTENEEQQTSYQGQVEYYTEYINNNKKWNLVEIFADELAIIRLNLKNLELSRGLNKSYFLFLKLLQRSRFL